MFKPRHITRLLVAAGVCALCASYAMGETPDARAGDRAWMEKVARANAAEVAAGQLAAARSTNAQVRAYAEQMVTEHNKNAADLRAIAQRKGMTLPDEPDAAHTRLLTRLEKFQGPQFDEQYIHNAGVLDHKAAVALFKQGSASLDDPEVKSFAQNNLPAIERHYDMALALSQGAPR